MKILYKYVFFIFLFAVLGFSRDFLFVNINSHMYKLYYGHASLPLPSCLSFLNYFDYAAIYYGKYILTLLYYFGYFFTSFFAVKVICHTKKNHYWVIYIYALLLILSALTMLFNYFINHNLAGEEYTFSRWLMGIAQSPLVAFFTIASSTLYKKFQTEN